MRIFKVFHLKSYFTFTLTHKFNKLLQILKIIIYKLDSATFQSLENACDNHSDPSYQFHPYYWNCGYNKAANPKWIGRFDIIVMSFNQDLLFAGFEFIDTVFEFLRTAYHLFEIRVEHLLILLVVGGGIIRSRIL